ncbi:MAG: RluA family pseudouridine synthase [Syntrophales bacterium]|nr:RluA family pseudouridine synthase [Syntrophales bacterium]
MVRSAKGTPERRSYRVGPDEGGARLDVYLHNRAPCPSRAQVAKAIGGGLVTVNGRAVKASYRVRPGDEVVFQVPVPEPSTVEPEDLPLVVLYEDPHILVVDKPAGMVVHPAVGNRRGTLVNALLYHCRDLAGVGGVLRPGIVHRLDRDTSGLLVVAKTDQAHAALVGQFREREVKKIYQAFVYGDLAGDEGTVDLAVGRHPVDRKRMSVHSRRGREALTRWRVAERFGVATLLDVAIMTGRTHQIRVHLHAIGHPVVGDRVYGRAKPWRGVDDPVYRRLRGVARQALHAATIAFTHPLRGDRMEFHAPLPADLMDLLVFLRSTRG